MQQSRPLPSRPPGMGHARARRSSAPFTIPPADPAAALEAATRSEGDLQQAALLPGGRNNTTKGKRQEIMEPALEEGEPQRESVGRSTIQEQSRQAQGDMASVVVSLQQNLQALTASNQREKTMGELMRKQLQALTTELSKAKELYDEEKAKNEKIAAIRNNQKLVGGEYGGFLPDIPSAAAAAAVAAALQQQAQLELTYQRKILSLENRYKDLLENNKRLLRKIEQLEKTEKDADSVIDDLRHKNVHLGTQNDTLSSTVASQTSLILGLRTSLQKLRQDDHQIGSLMKKLDRSQIELDGTKVREKVSRDDQERMKMIMSKEKEALMAKIMDFQQRLQQSVLARDNMEALQERIHQLESEKQLVVEDMVTLREHVAKSEERMHDQEQMTNRLLLENEALQAEKKENIVTLSRIQGGLHSKTSLELKLAQVRDREREVEELMTRNVQLQGDIDTLNQFNVVLQRDISELKQSQLSHDETVRALQLARQKAAAHEALTLINDEKQALDAKIHALEDEWANERAVLVGRIHEFEDGVNQTQRQIQNLQEELETLKTRPAEQVVVQVEARPSSAEMDERAQVEAAIERLREEYGDLQETFDAIEKEYNKLITKKYKTESFQSQVKLLQNENTELGSRLDDLLREQQRDRAELQARASEVIELQSRVLDPNAIELLRRTQESLEKTVSTLVEAEIASESTFTCLQCMRLFVSPMTLTPCGHTYCASCLDSMGDASVPSSIHCKECTSAHRQESESVFSNQALADLTARFIFRQQTLSSLTTMCLSLRNSFANRSGS